MPIFNKISVWAGRPDYWSAPLLTPVRRQGNAVLRIRVRGDIITTALLGS